MEYIDFEAKEIPEDAIENFCNIHKAEFDEDGNISAFHPLEWNDLDDNAKSILEWISHAKAKEMNESDIERLIDEVESDGNGYITDEVYNDICYGIDCETENI